MLQQTFLHRVDLLARRFVPFGLTLLLMLFALTPTRIPGMGHVTPMYALAAVYFWSIYRPDLIGFGTCLTIGLIDDAVTGAPIGCSSLMLLVCHQVVLHQQKFFNAKPFGIFWIAFALLALGASTLKWLCVGLFAQGGFTSVGDMFASAVLTAALYPFIAWLLAQAQLKLLGAP